MTASAKRATCEADITAMTQEEARQWLISNDREAAIFWAELPADTDFREDVRVNCRDYGFDEREWQPIATAPKGRDIELRGWYEPSAEAHRHGARAGYTYGNGRWLFGNHWSGIVGANPTHWREGA